MKYKILLILFYFLLYINVSAENPMSYYNSRLVKNEKEYFTVQIASYPMHEKHKAIELLNTFKKNYITYLTEYYPLNKRTKYLRVRIGCFDKYEDAKKFGVKLKEKGYDYFIDNQKFLESANQKIKILKIPSGIWISQNNTFKEIYDLSPSIFNRDIDGYYTQPFLSPKGDKVLFEYDSKIIVKNLTNNQEKIYTDHVYNSFPQISSSGKFIAYIKDNGWESWSGLKIITDDDSSFCLIDVSQKKGTQAVKNFRWHPEKDIIFYVMGYATGTVTVGGDIYGIDLSGRSCLLIPRNKNDREEITLDISIDNKFFHYKIAKYDEQFSEIIEVREEKILLTKLIEIFKSNK